MCFKKLFKKSSPVEDKVRYFTTEAVGSGHPDLVADAIADAIKDYYLQHDSKSRVAVEVIVTTQYVLLAGEVTSTVEHLPFITIVKDVMRRKGYTKLNKGFDVKNVRIYSKLHTQSLDIAQGTNDEVNGAGDQGIIFGYACDETVQYIPMSWAMARAITDRITRYSKELPEVFCPDCKSQVTLKYKGDSIVGVDTIVVAASHEPNMEDRVKEIILEDIIPSVLIEFGWSRKDVGRIFINGTGKFEVYGPNGDTGLTGRKLIVNQYGGHSAIGGGSMQGKDNTKVDISAALMARYIAKNIVAANLAERCQVELAYCIGRPNPVSINVECFGTEKVSTEKLERYFKSIDCSPKGIVSRFDLNMVNGRKFYYEDCSSNGWFGRTDVELPWEEVNLQLDKVDWTKY